MWHTQLHEPLQPPLERRTTGNAQQDCGNGSCARSLRASIWPVKEGHLGAGVTTRVRIEEVIGRDVVLVDGLLDQPQAKRLCIEGNISTAITSDGSHRVQAAKVQRHHLPPWSRVPECDDYRCHVNHI